MAKAILVMDMPKGCRECPCANIADEGWSNFCQVNKAHIFDDYKRTNCCPLREVPQKKKVKSLDEALGELKKGEKTEKVIFEALTNYGYNACIDELLGGGE